MVGYEQMTVNEDCNCNSDAGLRRYTSAPNNSLSTNRKLKSGHGGFQASKLLQARSQNIMQTRSTGTTSGPTGIFVAHV